MLLGGVWTLGVGAAMLIVDGATRSNVFWFWRLAPLYAAVGAIAGGLAGCGVGAWCNSIRHG